MTSTRSGPGSSPRAAGKSKPSAEESLPAGRELEIGELLSLAQALAVPVPAAADSQGVSAYRTSPLKRLSGRRYRRTKSEIEALRNGLSAIIEPAQPVTVRQAFYAGTVAGLVDKTEQGYGVVQRQLVAMREEELLPFGWIADNTRWMRKPRSFDSVEQLLVDAAASYRQALWHDQEHYVEVWLEKDALAGVVYDVTTAWDVPLMVTRGYSSVSFLYAAAEVIANVGKPTFIYYFGDLDPSGLDIPRRVEEALHGYAPEADIAFERVAVTRAQVEAWGLPSRPTKTTDTRSRSFVGDSVELDAIPADRLRELVQNCVERHIDEARLAVTLAVEAEEKRHLFELIRSTA